MGPRLSDRTIVVSVEVRWCSSCLIAACIAAHCCACCSWNWELIMSFIAVLCGGVPAKPPTALSMGGWTAYDVGRVAGVAGRPPIECGDDDERDASSEYALDGDEG